MNLILALIVLTIVILVHEFGHFIVCKLSGVLVEEFAIGFGPKLFSIKGKETEYSVRAFLIGGYVKPLGEDKDIDHPRALNNAKVHKRILMVLMGPVMNFVLAIIIMMGIGYFIGFGTNTIGRVEPNMPAYEAGIRSGDRIVALDKNRVYVWDQVSFYLAVHNMLYKDREVEIKVLRDGKQYIFRVMPKYDPNTKTKRIGIASKISRKNFFDSIYYGVFGTYAEIKETIYSVVLMITGRVSASEIMGPVGMVKTIGEAANVGFKQSVLSGLLNILWLMQLISVNLGVINLIPFPALDGSRLVFYLYEAVAKKPFNREKEALIHTIGFVLLLFLLIIVTFNDIKNIIMPGR
uniref:RIP metalloprotease n=1 Tax=Caldicellulosiruptor owensensis TaxID=55205 RepID=A0A7C5V4V4_9FIRM